MWLHSVHRTGSPVVLTGVEASDSPITKVQQLSCGATLERMDRERRSILVCQLPRIKKMWNSSQCEFWNIVPLDRIYRYRKRHCSRALKRQNGQIMINDIPCNSGKKAHIFFFFLSLKRTSRPRKTQTKRMVQEYSLPIQQWQHRTSLLNQEAALSWRPF